MKTAVVTGASGGIGLGISKLLIEMGYRVYGLARDFTKTQYEDTNFIKIKCDITMTNKLEKYIKDIKDKEERIELLVNNAGVGYFGPHEQVGTQKIHQMVATNLEAPLVLTHLLLRDLKESQGTIINVSSITAKKISTHGCAYAATKAGLSHFAQSLFEEVRKTGVKVTTLHPDMVKTDFFRYSDFKEANETDAHVTVEAVVDAVKNILALDSGMVMTDVTIRPQKNKIEKAPQNKKK